MGRRGEAFARDVQLVCPFGNERRIHAVRIVDVAEADRATVGVPILRRPDPADRPAIPEDQFAALLHIRGLHALDQGQRPFITDACSVWQKYFSMIYNLCSPY